MLGSKWLVVALAGSIGLLTAQAADAQVRTSERVIRVPVTDGVRLAGPTRYWAVPRANVLDSGANIMSGSLFLGANVNPAFAGAPGLGIGVTGNAVNLNASMGMGNNFELSTGLGILAATPWMGRLDVAGKWAWMEEGPSILSLAGLVGGVLQVDANGTPGIGVQVGVPISKTFAFSEVNYLNATLYPNWNMGVLNPATAVVTPGTQTSNFFGLGIGADLALSRQLHLLFDTNVGLAIAGVNTQSAVGVRYEFSRDLTGDLFVGLNAPGVGAATPLTGFSSLGIGANWRF